MSSPSGASAGHPSPRLPPRPPPQRAAPPPPVLARTLSSPAPRPPPPRPPGPSSGSLRVPHPDPAPPPQPPRSPACARPPLLPPPTSPRAAPAQARRAPLPPPPRSPLSSPRSWGESGGGCCAGSSLSSPRSWGESGGGCCAGASPGAASESARSSSGEEEWCASPSPRRGHVRGAVSDMSPRLRTGTHRASSLSSHDNSPRAMSFPGPEKTMTRRAHVVAELLTTEKTYVRQLSIVVREFVEPVKAMAALSAQEQMGICANVDTLAVLHAKFLAQLTARVESWSEDSVVGDVLIEASKWFKLYKYYINNYDDVHDRIKALKSKVPEFRKLLEKLEYSETLESGSLESFLILPVQRIPRYVLLVKELIKNTPSSHRDFQLIEEAMGQILEMADYINEMKRMSENQTRVMEVEGRWKKYDGNLHDTPERAFVRDFAVATPAKSKLHLWMFTDTVVVTSDSNVFMHRIPLKGASFQKNVLSGTYQLYSQEVTIAFTVTGDDADDVVELLESRMASESPRPPPRQLHQQPGKSPELVADCKRKCLRVVHQLVESEYDHIQVLEKARKVATLAYRCKSVPASFMSSFGSVCAFLERSETVHKALVEKLETREKEWGRYGCISDIFSAIMPDLKAYSQFEHNVKQYKLSSQKYCEMMRSRVEQIGRIAVPEALRLFPLVSGVLPRLSDVGPFTGSRTVALLGSFRRTPEDVSIIDQPEAMYIEDHTASIRLHFGPSEDVRDIVTGCVGVVVGHLEQDVFAVEHLRLAHLRQRAANSRSESAPASSHAPLAVAVPPPLSDDDTPTASIENGDDVSNDGGGGGGAEDDDDERAESGSHIGADEADEADDLPGDGGETTSSGGSDGEEDSGGAETSGGDATPAIPGNLGISPAVSGGFATLSPVGPIAAEGAPESACVLESLPEDQFVTLPRGTDLTCAICFCVPSPLACEEHTPCGRLFCRRCLDQWGEVNDPPLCPFCKKELRLSCRQVSRDNLSLYRLLRGLEIRCINSEGGCKQTCEWGDLATHVARCEYAQVSCANSGCTWRGLRRLAADHAKSCAHRLERCRFCREGVPAASMPEHLQRSCALCPFADVPCPVAGCTAVVKRSQLRRHLSRAAGEHVALLAAQVTYLEHAVHAMGVCDFDTRLRLRGAEDEVTSLFFAVGAQWRVEVQPSGADLSVFLSNVRRVPCCVTFSVAVVALDGSLHTNSIVSQHFPEDGYWTWGWGKFGPLVRFSRDLFIHISLERHW
eukprot:m51a1_g1078 putative pleckstrin domain-containing protein (1242) ;mRNA; r:9775-15834